MLYYIVKVLITSSLIVAISEISKRSTLMGSILASLPLVSFLAFIWIYVETKNRGTLISLSKNIFWMVLPSLSLFLVFPWLLEKNMSFVFSLAISTGIMIILYFLMIFILKLNGIEV